MVETEVVDAHRLAQLGNYLTELAAHRGII